MNTELSSLREKLTGIRIAVVGDVCLDWYLFIDLSLAEESVETGKLTRPVRTSRFTPGGAGNVAANLASLGVGSVALLGVIGIDPFAAALEAALEARGVERLLTVQTEGWHTSVYTKLYEHDEEDRRIDFGNGNLLADETERTLIESLEGEMERCDLLIVNQQLKSGIHTAAFRSALARLVASHPELPVIADSRDFPTEYPLTIRKLNEREAASCDLGAGPGDRRRPTGASAVASRLAALWGRPVVVTRGAYGCVVADGQKVHEVPGIEVPGGGDIVGAGDAFLAGFASALAAVEPIELSAGIGNLAAAVTVGKRFETGIATLDEIETLAAEPSFRYRPELAFGVPDRFFDGSEIEIITRRPDRSLRSAVFDHDGTISTLRQGWELVMEPMMVAAIRGEREVSPELALRIGRRVGDYIDATTGIQTITQMTGLVDLVAEFGLVPKSGILTPVEYKAIYNASLLQVVRERSAKYSRGELITSDVTVKGAVAWVESLVDRGLELYLASGTDEEDVRAEAELLGYARLFGGGIYGATGSVEDEPKKRVLRRILDKTGSAGSVVTFGDGPVEMRETVRRGGYAVGLASDEIRRFGPNPEKRRRLVLAGADAILPDFSQPDALAAFLFGSRG